MSAFENAGRMQLSFVVIAHTIIQLLNRQGASSLSMMHPVLLK